MLRNHRRRDLGLCLLGIAAAVSCCLAFASRERAASPGAALSRPSLVRTPAPGSPTPRTAAPTVSRSRPVPRARTRRAEAAQLAAAPTPAPPPDPVALEGAARLAGVVLDERGWHLADVELVARVLFVDDGGERVGQSHAPIVTRTAHDGRFAFEHLPSGAYELTARAPGLATKRVIRQLPSRTELELQLEPAGLLAGIVAGTPPDGDWSTLIVHARPRTADGAPDPARPVMTCVPDEAGRFVFESLPGGAEVALSVKSSAPAPSAAEVVRSLCAVRLARVDEPDVRLELLPRATVRFDARDARGGHPIEGLELCLVGERRVRLEADASAAFARERGGSFIVRELPLAAPCTLELRAPDGSRARRELPASADGATLELGTLELGARCWMSFEVIDAATDEPIAGAVLRLPEAGPWPAQRVRTDEDGRAELALAPGAARVQVNRAGYVLATEHLVVLDTQEPEPRRIALESAATLQVLVMDAEGAPVQGCGVAVERLEPTGDEAPRARLFTLAGRDRTDGGGRVARKGLRPGTYTVALFEPRVYAPGFLPEREPVHSVAVQLMPGEHRTLRLDTAPRADFELRVTAGGAPLDDALVQLARGSVIGAPLGRTDVDGRLQVRNARRGELHLHVSPAGGASPWTARVELEGTNEVRVDRQ